MSGAEEDYNQWGEDLLKELLEEEGHCPQVRERDGRAVLTGCARIEHKRADC